VQHPLPQNAAGIIIHRQTLLPVLHHVGEGLYRQLFESGHADILTQDGRISRKSEKNNRYFA
jgi:hypothetical protein